MENSVMNGTVFMIIGMSVVFAFLALLVLAVNAMKVFAALIDKYFPPKEEPAPVRVQSGGSEEIAAAIAVVCARKKP